METGSGRQSDMGSTEPVNLIQCPLTQFLLLHAVGKSA
jgi:hypothetical protein